MTLSNGKQLPNVGFGTFQAAEDGTEKVISMAIACGYRYFDTASFYGTEEALGRAIRESGIPREEFTVATKLWKTEMGYEEAIRACEDSLKRLGMDYIDIYMIHWPIPAPGYKEWRELDIKTWSAMEKLYEERKVHGLGLSNFLPHHMENIIVNGKVRPLINQIEFHPGHAQMITVNYCKEKGILPQAWSPIGRARILGDSLLTELAEKYHVSEAQICLRFAFQNGVMPIPKSSTEKRMKQNLDILGFELTDEEMYRLGTMPDFGWSGEHPDRARVAVQFEEIEEIY